MELARCGLFASYAELFALETFVGIAHFNAPHALALLETLEGNLVEGYLERPNGIEVAVHVEVGEVDDALGDVRGIIDAYATRALDGEVGRWEQLVAKVARRRTRKVDGTARLEVDECPNAVGMAYRVARIVEDAEQADGELAAHLNGPRADVEALAGGGAHGTFDDEARKHPAQSFGRCGTKAETPCRGMLLCTAQQDVA